MDEQPKTLIASGELKTEHESQSIPSASYV